MKIERIAENKIRCTLNKQDLSDFDVKLSEFAYGTPKARTLFESLMKQAEAELGFEPDEMPLMIEAMPEAPDRLILIITKVDNPEEFNTKFSKFTHNEEDDMDDEDPRNSFMNLPPDLDDKLPFGGEDGPKNEGPAGQKFASSVKKSSVPIEIEKTEMSEMTVGLQTFYNIIEAAKFAKMIAPYFKGESYLLQPPGGGRRFFLITNVEDPDKNVAFLLKADEYVHRTLFENQEAIQKFFEENEQIISENAIEVLKDMI